MNEQRQAGQGRLETLQTQYSLLQKTLELSSRQPALIQNEDMDGLNRCIAQRDALAEQIEHLRRGEASPAEGAQVELEAQIREMVDAIRKQDAENIRLAEEKLQEYAGKIKQVKQTRTGMRSYMMDMGSPEGAFFDKKK